MKKVVWLIVIVVIVGVLVIGALIASKMRKDKKFVEIVEVERRTIKSTVIAFGWVEPKSDVNISAEVSEKIENLYVEEGDTIKAGETLVILNRDRYLAALNRAEAVLRQNKANFNQANDNLQKIQELHKTGAISDDELITAQTQVEIFEAQVQSAEASVREASDNLKQTIIKSPIDGIVTAIQAEKGEFVVVGTMNNPGSSIMTIAQLTDLQSKVEVDEADVVDLKLGQESKIELDALPDTFFVGRTVQISHQAKIQSLGGEETRASFEVDIAIIDPSPKIKPGMSVTTTITTAIHDSVLTVPLASVVSYTDSATKQGEGVFIIRDGIAEKVKIRTGISDDRYIEVLEGIEEGDEIISGPFKILRELNDGDGVESMKPKPDKEYPKKRPDGQRPDGKKPDDSKPEKKEGE